MKLSTAHTGKNATMSNVHTGKKLSAKYLVNMNKARKGKNHSAEHRMLGQEARAIRTVKCCQHQSLACLAKLAPHGLDVIVILREQAAEVPEYLDFFRAVDVHLIFY